MGTLSFAKILKYGGLAAFGLAAAIAAIAALSTPASAQVGDGDKSDSFSWDTDNLAYGGFSAKNHRVPFHDYRGYLRPVKAIVCVRGNALSGQTSSGSCPSGYSQATQACRYSYARFVSTYSAPLTVAAYGPPARVGSCLWEFADVARCSGGSCFARTATVSGSKVQMSSYNVGLCRSSGGRYSFQAPAAGFGLGFEDSRNLLTPPTHLASGCREGVWL